MKEREGERGGERERAREEEREMIERKKERGRAAANCMPVRCPQRPQVMAPLFNFLGMPEGTWSVKCQCIQTARGAQNDLPRTDPELN